MTFRADSPYAARWPDAQPKAQAGAPAPLAYGASPDNNPVRDDAPLDALGDPSARFANHHLNRRRNATAAVALVGLVALSGGALWSLWPTQPAPIPIEALTRTHDYAEAVAIDPSIPDPTQITLDGAATPPPNIPLTAQRYTGPTAKPFLMRGAAGQDIARAQYCLTAALYYEAASESDDGMRGVAQVVLNRVRHPSFPATVCGVVFQGSQRAGVCQFTFACDGSMARVPNQAIWQRASTIAAQALAGRTFPGVGLATHYHTQAVWPRWGKSLVMTNVIGAHIFHRWRGRWGEPDAFLDRRYVGREPAPGPYLPVAAQLEALSKKSGIPSATSADAAVTNSVPAPVALPTTLPTAPTTLSANAPMLGAAPGKPAGKAPAPEPRRDYTDKRLETSGTVREEYQESGRWIGQQP